MIDSEYAIPMQDMIDKNDYDIASLEKNILDYYTIDGKLYSMPFNSSTPILFYNKTAFSEAGLTDKDIPTNFKEIIEVSSKLAVKEGDKVSRYGYAMQIYGWFFEQFLIKQGLDYANEGNGRKGDATEVVFNSNDGALNIIEGWKELVDSGVVGNFGRDSQNTLDAFSSGNVAMIVASTASLGDLKSKIGDNFELGTAYFPSVLERDNGGVSVGGASLWIMNNGDDERENAAFEFIKFMVSEQTQVKWSQATGYFSVSKKAYELPEMVEYLNKNPEFKTAIEQLREENNSSGAILGIFPEARASIEENIEKVLNNEITSKEAVKNMSKTINSALEKYNKSNK